MIQVIFGFKYNTLNFENTILKVWVCKLKNVPMRNGCICADFNINLYIFDSKDDVLVSKRHNSSIRYLEIYIQAITRMNWYSNPSLWLILEHRLAQMKVR